MPLSSNVSSNIRELKRSHPDWSDEQIQAAAINAAKRAKEKGSRKNRRLARYEKRTAS